MPTLNITGTWSVPVPPANTIQSWKVVLDYGTLINGAYTLSPPATAIGLGSSVPLTASNLQEQPVVNGGNYLGLADTLTVAANQIPANSAARVTLQLQGNNGKWLIQGPPVYFSFPAAVAKPCSCEEPAEQG